MACEELGTHDIDIGYYIEFEMPPVSEESATQDVAYDADSEFDSESDAGTYIVGYVDSVAVVEARRQIDHVFGLHTNTPSVTSVTGNLPAETQVTVAVNVPST